VVAEVGGRLVVVVVGLVVVVVRVRPVTYHRRRYCITKARYKTGVSNPLCGTRISLENEELDVSKTYQYLLFSGDLVVKPKLLNFVPRASVR
jgi:hypothetical protein